MRQKIFYAVIVTALIVFGLSFIHNDIFAQQEDPEIKQDPPEEEIPFIDRDGDGVNDLLQYGWGLRFLMRRRMMEELKQNNQNSNRNRQGQVLIDTDDDGVPDTPFREYMRERMKGLVDTDNDGEPDTPLGEHIRKRYGTFDRDGDGVPDIATADEVREYLQETAMFQKKMMDRIEEGLPPFVDEDGDGIPDDLPMRLRWQKGKNNNPDN